MINPKNWDDHGSKKNWHLIILAYPGTNTSRKPENFVELLLQDALLSHNSYNLRLRFQINKRYFGPA
jgi:hypothetical protein